MNDNKLSTVDQPQKDAFSVSDEVIIELIHAVKDILIDWIHTRYQAKN